MSAFLQSSSVKVPFGGVQGAGAAPAALLSHCDKMWFSSLAWDWGCAAVQRWERCWHCSVLVGAEPPAPRGCLHFPGCSFPALEEFCSPEALGLCKHEVVVSSVWRQGFVPAASPEGQQSRMPEGNANAGAGDRLGTGTLPISEPHATSTLPKITESQPGWGWEGP